MVPGVLWLLLENLKAVEPVFVGPNPVLSSPAPKPGLPAAAPRPKLAPCSPITLSASCSPVVPGVLEADPVPLGVLEKDEEWALLVPGLASDPVADEGLVPDDPVE